MLTRGKHVFVWFTMKYVLKSTDQPLTFRKVYYEIDIA